MRKRISYISMMLCLQYVPLHAQLHVSPGSVFHVQANTPFSVDSLIFIPQLPISFEGQQITRSASTLQTVGGIQSIERVYLFTPAVNFKGIIGMYYSDADLNGNSEANLNVAYSNNGTLNVLTGSTRVLSANKITRKITAATDIEKLSAISQPVTCTKAPPTPGGITQAPAMKPCPG
ncbi:MAG: hypothetical protein EOP51_15045, partial [Sphingobacteriales bacterium]